MLLRNPSQLRRGRRLLLCVIACVGCGGSGSSITDESPPPPSSVERAHDLLQARAAIDNRIANLNYGKPRVTDSSVSFPMEIEGIPVAGGAITVFFDPDGNDRVMVPEVASLPSAATYVPVDRSGLVFVRFEGQRRLVRVMEHATTVEWIDPTTNEVLLVQPSAKFDRGTANTKNFGLVTIDTERLSSGTYRLFDQGRNHEVLSNCTPSGTSPPVCNEGRVSYNDLDNVWGTSFEFGARALTSQNNWLNGDGQTTAAEGKYILATEDDFIAANSVHGYGLTAHGLNLILFSSLTGRSQTYNTPKGQIFIDNRDIVNCGSILVDIVAHEAAHTFFFDRIHPVEGAGGETGAINEANSDVIAEIIKVQLARRLCSTSDSCTGNPAIEWEHKGCGLPSRWFAKPSDDGHSLDAWNRGIDSSPLEGHYSGGPIRRLFYYLVNGVRASSNSNLLEGTPGMGFERAASLWIHTVESLPGSPGQPTFVDLRETMLGQFKLASVAERQIVKDCFAAIKVGLRADHIPPVVSISVTRGQSAYAVNGAASDNLGVDSVALYVDNKFVEFQVINKTRSSFAFSLPYYRLTNGTHVVEVRATDSDGNQGRASMTVFLSVPLPPPMISSITVRGPHKTPTLVVSAAQTTKVTVVRNNVVFATSTSLPYEFLIDTRMWSDGTYPLTIVASNASSSVTQMYDLKADNTAPSVSTIITIAPFQLVASAVDMSPMLEFRFLFDNVEKYRISGTSRTQTWDYAPSDALAHQIKVEVRDEFDNVGSRTLPAPSDTQGPLVNFNVSQFGM